MRIQHAQCRVELGVAVAAAVLLLTALGATDLWAPDEPRYGQVAEELRARVAGARGAPGELAAGLVLLRLNDEAYTQKPPLYYWLAAAAGAPGSRVDEWAARLPSALAGMACALLTLQLARVLFDPATGLWSALVLLTVFRFGHLSRRAQLDPLLCALELGAWLAFAVGERAPRSTRGPVLWLHACLGGAVLTKGPVGLLPLLGMAVYLAWSRRLRELGRWLPVWGLALSLGPALLWLGGAVALAPAGFFEEAVSENLLGRFFSGTSHERPFYYFFYQLPLDFLPWTLCLPWVVREARRGLAHDTEASAWRVLLAWSGALFVFFSLSAGKRGLYLLPIFPALAIGCGRSVRVWCERSEALPRAARRGLAAASGLLASLGLAVMLGPPWPMWPDTSPWPRSLGAGLLVSAAAGPLLARGLRDRLGARRAWGAGVVAVLLATELCTFALGFPALDPEKSPRPVVEAAAAIAGEGWLGVFDHRSFVGGAAYYSGRRVVDVPDAQAARELARRGPGALIVRSDRFERLDPGRWEVRRRLRSGRREILLLSPRPASDRRS